MNLNKQTFSFYFKELIFFIFLKKQYNIKTNSKNNKYITNYFQKFNGCSCDIDCYCETHFYRTRSNIINNEFKKFNFFKRKIIIL